MRAHFLLFSSLLILGSSLRAADPVTLVLPTGEVVQCVEVRRMLPAAVQFVDARGQVRMISKKDIPPEMAPRLRALLPNPSAASPAPTATPASVGPVLYVDVVPVGSKSSTRYQYYTWYGYRRTTESGATYEIRLTLARPKKYTAKVITLVGQDFNEHDVPLEQGRPTALRLETTGSRTVTNHYWYTRYAIEKRARDSWFVQVVCDGKLHSEEGTRPPNLARGEILQGPENSPKP